ncbi:glycoside hydrolase family 55 protein [Sphingobium sp. BYY-5]|uniref:glycoside hydrolase family 55 protein n=1 Tax=Sphingobium sp. BYY-5 TaxID=2926400 RepID=UPI001FA7EE27|nr:glycoside hydrolase family 55 protein [Sphingobium sp. BYY-5]MCI4589862.1 glycoside hydrolase family 55 protein [Sphingobium sp. BYY-5]
MTFNSNITQRVSSWISVEEFGAVGDGLVNDEFAIQEAINYAITYRLKLYLGSGKNFRITKPMLVPVYTGQNNLYLDGNGSTITMTSADFAFKIIAAQDDVRGIPQFRNMVIAGSSASGFDVGQNFDNMATPKMYGDGRGPMFYNILTSQLGGIALRIQNAAHFDVDKFIARTDNYTGD